MTAARWRQGITRIAREGALPVVAALLAAEQVVVRESDHGSAHLISLADPDGIRLELTTYEVT